MRIRTIVFWTHLTAGVCAGAVILVMSFTGVLLMYERQILAWADQGTGSAACGAARLPLRVLVDRVRAADAAVKVTGITVRADPAAPVTIAAGSRTLFVDGCRGVVIGDSSRSRVRAVMSSLREWHRWLAFRSDARPAGRAITGWASVVFLGARGAPAARGGARGREPADPDGRGSRRGPRRSGYFLISPQCSMSAP